MNYVKAKTPRGLRLAMLRRNAELGAMMNYFDIQFVKNEGYAWYLAPSEMNEAL